MSISANLNRPAVGFNPQMPQKADGIRILPPISVPKPRTDPCDAIKAASPPEEPPGVQSGSKGFFVRPKTGFTQEKLDKERTENYTIVDMSCKNYSLLIFFFFIEE